MNTIAAILDSAYSSVLSLISERKDNGMSTHKPELLVDVRYMIRRDLEECLVIEKRSFEFPWTEEDFLTSLRQRNCIGMISEERQAIVGYMTYELLMKRIHVTNFAVHPEFRHQGVGTQMVGKLIRKLSQQRRQEIVLEVRETNLSAHLFFRSMGFLADPVILRKWYYDTDEDAYQFFYQLSDCEL